MKPVHKILIRRWNCQKYESAYCDGMYITPTRRKANKWKDVTCKRCLKLKRLDELDTEQAG